MVRTAVLVLLCGSLCFGDTLVLRNGNRVNGTLDSVSENYITLDEGGTLHRFRRSEVQRIELTSGNTPALENRNYNDRREDEPAPAPEARNYSDNGPQGPPNGRAEGRMNGRDSVTLPAGTDIGVITTDPIDSKDASEGQTFAASIANDITDPSGRVVIPKGADAELVIRSVNSGGATGTSDLALDLQSVRVGGNTYDVSTEDIQQQGNAGIGKNKRTGEYVGGGAVLGTLIGAIAGGGKGAAIGAIAGAGAGAGAQVLTRGKSVHVPSESRLTFRLDQPLHLRPE